MRLIDIQQDLANRIRFHISSDHRLAVLTGAGISTGSGIPDYRGKYGTYTIQKDYKPVTYQQFTASDTDMTRKRYWARSFLGWPTISAANPNVSHHVLARLQQAYPALIPPGLFITQNVDGLHTKAGTDGVIELHGTLRNVVCLRCRRMFDREWFQKEMERLNPDWIDLLAEVNDRLNAADRERDDDMEGDLMHTLGVQRRLHRNLANRSRSQRPDGDIDIGSRDYSHFKYPTCNCDTTSQDISPPPRFAEGIMKPDVVFFGENLSTETRDASYEAIDEADALLVIGSSLEVYSAFRIVRKAHEQQKPIYILNVGSTRASKLSDIVQYEHDCNEVLVGLAQELKIDVTT